MRKKKIPIRKCVGCSESKPKKELIRIVKNQEGDIFLDVTGKANGRGVYICNSIDCLNKARKSKAINRSFKADVPNEVFDKLEMEIKENG